MVPNIHPDCDGTDSQHHQGATRPVAERCDLDPAPVKMFLPAQLNFVGVTLLWEGLQLTGCERGSGGP